MRFRGNIVRSKLLPLKCPHWDDDVKSRGNYVIRSVKPPSWVRHLGFLKFSKPRKIVVKCFCNHCALPKKRSLQYFFIIIRVGEYYRGDRRRILWRISPALIFSATIKVLPSIFHCNCLDEQTKANHVERKRKCVSNV